MISNAAGARSAHLLWCVNTDRNRMIAKLRRLIVEEALFIERWILPLVFLYFALLEVKKIYGIWSGQVRETTLFIDMAHHVILLVVACMTALLLIVARRPATLPDKFQFIFVPLVTTFYTVLYYFVPRFPGGLRANLAPASWQTSLVTVGLALIIIGPIFSLWGLLYLRRSFGVYVALRKIVLSGPYRWVRHPMYLGWVFICAGVAIANFSIAYFLLTGFHVLLLLYRARLEERRLAEQSPEYRAYMAHSGFIFPRFFGGGASK
jgi:protein-S-isoprenylcysteine O-methyltransferase Ste14